MLPLCFEKIQVGCIRYIEQKNGILSICQTAPLSQVTNGSIFFAVFFFKKKTTRAR